MRGRQGRANPRNVACSTAPMHVSCHGRSRISSAVLIGFLQIVALSVLRVGSVCVLWGLTFDMSGGPKGAQRPLERPLDGGVRRHFTSRTQEMAFLRLIAAFAKFCFSRNAVTRAMRS